MPSAHHFYSVEPTNGDANGFLAGHYDDALKVVITSLADDAGFTRWWNEIKMPSGKVRLS